jgi:hypothetical protein
VDDLALTRREDYESAAGAFLGTGIVYADVEHAVAVERERYLGPGWVQRDGDALVALAVEHGQTGRPPELLSLWLVRG